VEAPGRRSVTAGHGMVTTGRPILAHRGSGHGSHDAGPAAQASTARHTGVASSRTLAWRDRSRGPSVRHVSPNLLEPPFAVPTGPDFGRVAEHMPCATLRSRLRYKMSQGLKGPLPGSSASQLTILQMLLAPRRAAADCCRLADGPLLEKVSI
jgi:hypothetical protein